MITATQCTTCERGAATGQPVPQDRLRVSREGVGNNLLGMEIRMYLRELAGSMAITVLTPRCACGCRAAA